MSQDFSGGGLKQILFIISRIADNSCAGRSCALLEFLKNEWNGFPCRRLEGREWHLEVIISLKTKSIEPNFMKC